MKGGPDPVPLKYRFSGDGLPNDGDATTIGTQWARLLGNAANEALDLGWYKFGTLVGFRSARGAGSLNAIEFHGYRPTPNGYSAVATIKCNDQTHNSMEVRNFADTKGLVLVWETNGFALWTDSSGGDGDKFDLGIAQARLARLTATQFQLASTLAFEISSGAVGASNRARFSHDGSNAILDAVVGALCLATGGTNRWNISATDVGDLVSAGNARFSHGTSALAVSATTGFFHLQSCAGGPTGTPANIPSGQIPMVVDSVTGQTCKYVGGVWRADPITMDVNSAAVGNVGSGTDDLISYTLPANVFTRNNRTVRIKVRGTTANNANAKTLTYVVGSQTVLTTALTTSIAGAWEIEVEITRTGSNTQDIRARCLQGATLIYDQEFTAGTQTESGTIVLKSQAAATSNNDIVAESQIVEVIN